jgi:hypothetical protein
VSDIEWGKHIYMIPKNHQRVVFFFKMQYCFLLIRMKLLGDDFFVDHFIFKIMFYYIIINIIYTTLLTMLLLCIIYY